MRKSSVIKAVVMAIMASWFLWSSTDLTAERKSIASLFPMSDEFDFEPPASGSYKLQVIKPAPDGVVLTSDGTRLKLSDVLADKISLISFVYLMCSDENGCPLATSTLFEIYDNSEKAKILHKNVQLITISFDPARDTVEAVKSFLYPILQDDKAVEKIAWRIFTTENQTALAPILKGFGQVVDRSSNPEILNHLLRMYLVDRRGDIRNIYGLGMIDPRLLMTDIETLLLEDGTL